MRHAHKPLEGADLVSFGLDDRLLGGGFALRFQLLDGPQAGLNLVADVLGHQRHFLDDLLLVMKAREGGLELPVEPLELVEQARAPALLARLLPGAELVVGLPVQGADALDSGTLATYDEALRFSSPENAPLGYAATQSNRAAILNELANITGENRHERLLATLDAHQEALRFYSPETTPLTYAATQNNLAITLNALADIPGEQRHERLLAALAAYDAALQLSRPENAPLDYAANQNNRAIVLNSLAYIPGEDQLKRLQAALDASEQALRFYSPETNPIAYALIQGNLVNIYCTLAVLAGEQRHVFLGNALQAGLTALTIFQEQQPSLVEQAQDQVRNLRIRFPDEFSALWDALAIGPQPDWLSASGSSNTEAANTKTISEKIAIAIEKVMTLRITTVVGLVTATNANDGHMGLDIQLPAGPHECATTTVDLLQGDITQIRTEKSSPIRPIQDHDDALTAGRQIVADDLAALKAAIIGLEKFLPRAMTVRASAQGSAILPAPC